MRELGTRVNPRKTSGNQPLSLKEKLTKTSLQKKIGSLVILILMLIAFYKGSRRLKKYVPQIKKFLEKVLGI